MDIDGALKELSKVLVERYGSKIKAIWTYGSYARGTMNSGSDIDILILLDDVSQKIGVAVQNDIFTFAQFIGNKIKKENKIKNEFHFQPPRTLTDWWDLLRSGEPWVYTGMHDAKILYDPSGFVEPIKRLLNEGRIYATKEKSIALLRRAKSRYESLHKKILIDVMSKILRVMVETSQAVLMYYGEPPLYDEMLLSKMKYLADKKLIKDKYFLYLEDIYKVNELIKSGDMGTLRIRDVERYINRGMEFIGGMEKLFEKLEIKKKKMIIRKSHEQMMKIAKAVLKSFGVKVKSERSIVKKLKELSKKGYITPLYIEFIKHIIDMRKKMNNVQVLSEKDIYNSRVYVKTLESLLEMAKYEKKRK